MTERKKILIIEHDDFLRELIGNLLHKKGSYILNGYSIDEGLKEAQKHVVDMVILGTSCAKFHEKETVQYLRKALRRTQDPVFYIINETGKLIDDVPESHQYSIEHLSVQKIIQDVTS